jgi:hypothetical protein
MVSDNAINVSVWDGIRTALTQSTMYVVNSTTNASVRASVEAQYSDTLGRPQVVILPMEISESNFKYSSSTGKRIMNVTIECYYSNTLGIEQLADQVDNLIKAAVPTLGMDLTGITSSYGYAGTGTFKNHLLSLTYTFDRE